MKRHFEIKKSSEIPTTDGYMVVKGINNSGLIYLYEYEIDENGDAIAAGERHLTAEEIRNELKNVDGLNHSITINL